MSDSGQRGKGEGRREVEGKKTLGPYPLTRSPLLELQNLYRFFEQGGEQIKVLNGVDLSLQPGEVVALVGPSGSGKTTLLQVAGLLDRADSGWIRIDGVDYSAANDAKRTAARKKHIGFVYQFHHLLPEFTACENLCIPQIINGVGKAAAVKKAEELLEVMGLSDRRAHRPSQLSGGQQQRVAIARALSNNPSVILADEPTGNLDEANSGIVFDLLREMIKKTNCCALIATHNQGLVAKMDRVLRIHGGKVE